MDDQDRLLFADELEGDEGGAPDKSLKLPWKILIIDDEPSIHSVTKLVLKDFEWEGRSLAFYDAYNASEAKQLLDQEQDLAVCLVDVVMETNEAGLGLVRYIRDELKNTQVRIVLRTGQPGYAPEKAVIREYDINDYKDKTELTDTKLDTLMCSTLRNYRDIVRLDNNRMGLEMVIESSARIFETTSLQKFTSAVLLQLISFLNVEKDALFVKVESGFTATSTNGNFHILAGIGSYEGLVDSSNWEVLDESVRKLFQEAFEKRQNIFGPGHLLLYSESRLGSKHMLYLQHQGEVSGLDKKLIDLFCSNVCIAYENHTLNDEVDEAQKEMVYRLSEAVENRSVETGNHIRRVAEISYLLALEMGYSEEEAVQIRVAAPLHDIGKIGIPDHVLHKPGKLDDSEWKLMQTHVDIGYDMLKNSPRQIMQFAAFIARDHHEKWNGQGYPKGTAGQDIHLLGRIVAVADVFDALVNKRCYKGAWTIDDAMQYLQQQSGQQFDPQVIEGFMRRRTEIILIQERYVDLDG